MNNLISGSVTFSGLTASNWVTVTAGSIYYLAVAPSNIHKELTAAEGQGLILQNGNPSISNFEVIGTMTVSGYVIVYVAASSAPNPTITLNYSFMGNNPSKLMLFGTFSGTYSTVTSSGQYYTTISSINTIHSLLTDPQKQGLLITNGDTAANQRSIVGTCMVDGGLRIYLDASNINAIRFNYLFSI